MNRQVNVVDILLWLYRFGMRPGTAGRNYGARFVTASALPSAKVALEDCGGDE